MGIISVVMIKVYIDQQRQEVISQAREKIKSMRANEAPVLVAKKDIPRGSSIDESAVESQVVPGEYIQPKAVSSLERTEGMVTLASISKGEQITLSKLGYAKQAGGLAESTPSGKRAITISVDAISSLGGMIKPGDYVDVLSMINVPVQSAEGKMMAQTMVMPLFQNILILAVGNDTGALRARSQDTGTSITEKSGASPLITLALSPQEANLIAFVSEQGKIKLVLRSPADSQIEQTQPVNIETLFRYLMPSATPQEVTAAAAQEKANTDGESIEIIRGLNKGKIPLSK